MKGIIYILLLLSLSFGTVIDIDGNVYETVQIGGQLWMAENLKVTRYNNGDEITCPSDDDWGSLDEGQYAVYDNELSNADIYGNLYNWPVVDDERDVCPEGWHVPSNEEYTILIDYLGGQFVVGGQMKSTGTIESSDGLWYSPNLGATNESGFTGLPTGYHHSTGAYHNMGIDSYFWSSSEYTSSEARNQKLYYNNFYVTSGYGHKQNGYSIRCLEDEITTGCTNLHEGNNLISFSTLPTNGLDDFPECINAISGEGIATIYTENGWIGSLTELSCGDGYWFINTCSDFEWCYNGLECSEGVVHSLHMGSNLISYTLSDCGSIEEVLPDDVENCVYAIAGEGIATLNTDFGWLGSLTALCPDDGYWFVSECDINFTYDEPTNLARQTILSLSPYAYNQSSEQAFYFIESVENIEISDWILSFNGDKVIGAREWVGSIIDVPVMGDDGSDFTAGYIEEGSSPTFKLLHNDKLIDLEGDIPLWGNNNLYMVGNLTETIARPETFSLERAYPNPFNPVTTLSFAMPIETQVSISVYNLQGRKVISLVDGNMEVGCHSVVWNADAYASGVYFVEMVAGDYINIQKLMLVK